MMNKMKSPELTYALVGITIVLVGIITWLAWIILVGCLILIYGIWKENPVEIDTNVQ